MTGLKHYRVDLTVQVRAESLAAARDLAEYLRDYGLLGIDVKLPDGVESVAIADVAPADDAPAGEGQ